jgi:hypothetical protein
MKLFEKELDNMVSADLEHAKLSHPLKDLGWCNAGGDTERKINEICSECRGNGHHTKDKDMSFYRNGSKHEVTCDLCGYVYHYDSSD